MSKHSVMQEWVQKFLDDAGHLYFESTQSYPGIRTMIPNFGDYARYTDILGYKYKSYTFVFIGYEEVDEGTSDVNVRNMELFDAFLEWLEEREENKDYPDFGEKCSEYEIHPLQNMANLATITEEGIAKYMLAVRIDYKEE